MEISLTGRVAIVTGASKGIGRQIAIELADAGADLLICARGRAALAAVAEEIRWRGRAVEAVSADVATAAGTAQVLERARARFGRADVLVNNAGKGSPKRMLDLTDADWDESFALNLMSAVRLSLGCIPMMRAQHGGRIINISSRVGRQPDPYFAPYAAAKAALINFTKNLANAFSKDQILCNCVVPGLVRTEAVEAAARERAAASGQSVEEVFAATLRKRPIPIGRIGEPADIAGLVVFLASPRASWITGSTFTVDGGIVPTAP
jgi:NAD(P)-dependent dehydrogenase (short-subunit alcohol dehydrogenase family)